MGPPSATTFTDETGNGSDHEVEHRLHDGDDDGNDAEERSLPLQVEDVSGPSNIHQLTCAFLAALTTGGTTYAFGLYGDALKKSLHLSQPQLDTISTANFCAGLFSWIPGLVVDKMGVRTGLVSGGLLGSVSLCLYWGVATQFFPVERWMLVPTLSALGVLIFLSCALITGSVFKIIVSTCGPGSKGTAVGAAKGYVGLGAGVYASMFESLQTPKESDLDFLPMAALFFLVCVTIPSLCLMPSHETIQTTTFRDESTPLHFRCLYLSLGAMATLIIGQAIAELMEGEETEKGGSGQNIPVALFLVTIWMGPIFGLQFLPTKSSLPVPEPTDLGEDEGESLLHEVSEDNNNNSGASQRESIGDISLQRLNSSGGDTNNDDDFLRVPPSAEEENEFTLDMNNEMEQSTSDDEEIVDKTLCQMLRTPSALLMLWTTTILVGAGIVETNNMGQMVEALHFPKVTTGASLAFFSVAQSGGRVFTGAISESALNWNTGRFCIDNGIPRPFFLIVASLAGLVAHSLLAMATTRGLFVVGTTLAGLAFGMVWPLMVLIVGEVFGTANMAANYMFFDGFTSAAGSVLLSKFVAQEVYEDHIDRKDDPHNVTCLGSGCYAMTHAVCAALSAVCIFTALCLLKTTRNIYNRDNLHKT